MKRGFASDNNSGIHPEILKALSVANEGHAIGYGGDQLTEMAVNRFKQEFGDNLDVYFVFNGTGANVLGLSTLTHSFHSIICADTAHIQTDECGAPEKLTGCKLLPVETYKGKISPEGISKYLHGFDFEHHSQPKVISITQSTEMGTVYSAVEIREIADFAHSKGMLLHMDGARIANAAVALNLPFKAFTTDAGVDVLSFGGTKNGMMFGEAICFLKPGLSTDFKYMRKQGMQLASKMRFISAQYIAYFRDELWKKSASHSNDMAKILAKRLEPIKGIKITQKVQSNGVFVIMPSEVAERVRKQFFFYPWDEKVSEYRLMTSWDTIEEDIDGFVKLLLNELRN